MKLPNTIIVVCINMITVLKYNVYGRGCARVNRTINGELLMCINAEPEGRGINARLTQNRFHKRYSAVT